MSKWIFKKKNNIQVDYSSELMNHVSSPYLGFDKEKSEYQKVTEAKNLLSQEASSYIKATRILIT
jgi:hypothetical protein